jgi:thiazole/oxazole-forming peptide maturase SagC family component
LARLGVGQLIVMDDRNVNTEQIDRRYFDLVPDAVKAGQAYVDCLRRHFAAWKIDHLEAVNAPLTDEASLRAVASQADFLVAALESYSARILHAVNAVTLEAEKPWMSVYTDGSEALIGPIYVPGETCCYNEYEIQHEATLVGMKEAYLLYKEALSDERVDESHLVLPPYLHIASGLAATAIVRFLLSGRSALVGRSTRLDFERLSVDYEDVLRLPRCPACSSQRPAHRNPFM